MSVSKKMLFSFVFALLATSYSALAATEPTITYKNQRGSTLTLIWHADKRETGTLTGTFTTAVGNCKADVGVPLPISGFFNGNAIAITVNFPHCKQVVAMTGHLTANRHTLSTLWLDAAQAKDPIHKDWNANITGADYYEQVELNRHEQ
jgi:hypothetical protein